MPKRNDKRDTAKAEYVKRRRSGEKINLKDFANDLGVTYGTVRNWKKIDRWEDAIERKRGGQPGNKFLSTPSARRATAKTETKSLFSNKLYNILHEFRRALIYNGSKNDPNHAK